MIVVSRQPSPSARRSARPSAGAGARDDGDDGELTLMLESEAKGLTRRETAVRFWGAGRVPDEWRPDRWMAGHFRRRRRRAKAVLTAYLDIATAAQAGSDGRG
ncbi:MAG: hypothetical protein OXH76_06445 [Boseongicola sp.]|nr:hypothetical protein [Boseongicola sp.]